jgi:NAD(P)-dependent dehydrogenase (short-subunit alcohol dehydrogenase family)
VIVTGAGSGMGRAIAHGFAQAGANVIAADINDEGGAETAASIVAAKGTATFVHTDVGDGPEVATMVNECMTRYGRLDCAINAAAIEGETVALADLDDETFDRIQRINVRSVFLCMKHQINAMLSCGNGGAIVNIASTNSFRPQPHQSAYTASKHAVIGLTKSAAIDYAPLGIRINAIAPGAIDTPMLRAAMQRRGRNEADVVARLSLLGRFGAVDEIARAAMWLCSDEATFTVGHTLAVDGGYLAR